MKKVLGLDLGVGSVGWSLVNVDDNYKPTEILGIGSRIISLSRTNHQNSPQAMPHLKIRNEHKNALPEKVMTDIR